VFYCLFTLLEDSCHDLDLEIIEEEDSRYRGGSEFVNYIDDVHRPKTLKDELDSVICIIICNRKF